MAKAKKAVGIIEFESNDLQLLSKKVDGRRLQETEEFCATLLNNVFDAVFIHDFEGRFHEVNEEACKRLGYRKEDFLAKSIHDIVPSDLGKKVQSYLEKIKKSEKLVFETILIARSGIIVPVAMLCEKIRYKGQSAILSIARDQSEEKKAKESLTIVQNELDQLDQLLDTMVPLVVIDNDCNIVRVNKTFCSFFSLKKNEVLGRKCYDIWKESRCKTDSCSIKRIHEGLDHLEYEMDGQLGDVRIGSCMVTVVPFYGSQGEISGIVGTFADKTQRKQTEEALLKKTYQLGKRIRELDCLFDISKIVDLPDIQFEEMLQKLVELIPPAWQYPEITCARFIVADKVYKTKNYRKTPWRITSEVWANGDKVGIVEVDYLVEKLKEDEGPFLKEERGLINVISERIGKIFERKQVEEALRIKDSAIASCINAIKLMDLDGTMSYVNSSYLQMYGHTDESEVLGRSAIEFWESKEKALEIMNIIKEKGSWIGELTAKRKDGSEFHVQLSASMVNDKLGNPACMMCSFIDITDRKKTEDALRTSEERLKLALEASNEGLWDWNVVTGEMYFGPRFVNMLGFKPEEMGADIDFLENLMHPDDRDSVMTALKEHLYGRTPYHVYEYRIMTKFGEWRWILSRGKVVTRDKKGQPLRFVGTHSDITLRKLAEEKLQNTLHFLQTLMETIPIPIFYTDIEGTFMGCNRAFEKFIGLTKEQIIGKSIYELSPKELAGKYREKDLMLFEQPGVQIYEAAARAADGKKRDIILNKAPFIDSSGKIAGLVGVMQDVSEIKGAERNQKRLYEKLLKEHGQRKMLSKRIMELLEMDRHHVARELHDHVGQALTTLKIDLEMIPCRMRAIDDSMMTILENATYKVMQIIKDVKDIAFGLSPTMLDNLGLISALQGLFYDIQKSTTLEIDFFHQDVPKRFNRKKEVAIYRVAQEAIGNVIKHAKAKHIFVNLIKKDKSLMLSVEDDGVGFDPFSDETLINSQHHLGLLIMRERMNQVDGSFSVESRPKGGTHILAEMPL
jgi:PAS domain S-box-containing protein